jgi:iron complex outermembrane receptor protein
MKKFGLLLLIGLFNLVLEAQYDIYGTILDEDSQPYVGMVIELYDTEYSVQTDLDGFYLIESVPEGDYAMILHHPYGDVHKAVYLYDEDLNYDVSIRRRIEFDQIIVEGTRMTGEEPFNEETLDRKYIEDQNLGQDVPYL